MHVPPAMSTADIVGVLLSFTDLLGDDWPLREVSKVWCTGALFALQHLTGAAEWGPTMRRALYERCQRIEATGMAFSKVAHRATVLAAPFSSTVSVLGHSAPLPACVLQGFAGARVLKLRPQSKRSAAAATAAADDDHHPGCDEGRLQRFPTAADVKSRPVLKRLDLSSAGAGTIDWTTIEQAYGATLEELDVSCTNFSTADCTFVSHLRKLRVLCMSKCTRVERLPRPIASLQELYLNCTKVFRLVGMPSVTKLDISHCLSLEPTGISWTEWPSLTSLDLTGATKLVSAKSIAALVSSLGTSLHHLVLGGSAVTSEVVEPLEACTSLRRLELCATMICDAGLSKALRGSSARLEELDLRKSNGISALPSGLSSLKLLRVNGGRSWQTGQSAASASSSSAAPQPLSWDGVGGAGLGSLATLQVHNLMDGAVADPALLPALKHFHVARAHQPVWDTFVSSGLAAQLKTVQVDDPELRIKVSDLTNAEALLVPKSMHNQSSLFGRSNVKWTFTPTAE